jgi:hypothetical protein
VDNDFARSSDLGSFSVDDVVTNLLMKTLEKAAELIAVMAAIQAHNAESRAPQ